MNVVRLATGIATRDDRILLVASRYPNHDEPLWNLPGGRLAPGELFHEAVVREVREETGYAARVERFAYLNESHDDGTHFVSVAFEIAVEGTLQTAQSGDHVCEAGWYPVAELGDRLRVAVIREPLLAYLRQRERYFARHEAGVRIRWDD